MITNIRIYQFCIFQHKYSDWDVKILRTREIMRILRIGSPEFHCYKKILKFLTFITFNIELITSIFIVIRGITFIIVYIYIMIFSINILIRVNGIAIFNRFIGVTISNGFICIKKISSYINTLSCNISICFFFIINEFNCIIFFVLSIFSFIFTVYIYFIMFYGCIELNIVI